MIDLPDPAASILADYVATVCRGLPATGRARGEIAHELTDGLVLATEFELARGTPPTRAATAATDQFGPPRVVARAFASELALARAWTVGRGLLVSGPLVGAAWLAASGPMVHATPLDVVRLGGPVVFVGVVMAVLLVAVALVGVGVVAGSPTAGRRRPRTALHAASLACLATVACDLLAIAGLGPSVLASGTAATGLVLVAAMASLVRLVLVGASWRRCHTTLATLG